MLNFEAEMPNHVSIILPMSFGAFITAVSKRNIGGAKKKSVVAAVKISLVFSNDTACRS